MLSFSAIFLLIFSSKPVAVKENIQNKKNNSVDLVKLEANYKQDVKKILIEYESVVSSSTESNIDPADQIENQASGTPEADNKPKAARSAKIAELKNRLLDLTVPPVSALMDLHVSLVLAFSKMESYLASSNLKEYEESEKSIKLAKNNYQWLNQ